jgi:hypothetical protein
MAYSVTPALVLALAKSGHEIIATTSGHNPELTFGMGHPSFDGLGFTEDAIKETREYAKEDGVKLGTITRLGKERVKATKALLEYLLSAEGYAFYLSDDDAEWIFENYPQYAHMVQG